MRRLIVGALGAVALAAVTGAPAEAAGRCGDHRWCDTRLSPERRAALLVRALAPGEKLDLLAGDDGTGLVAPGPDTHTSTSRGVPRLDVPDIRFTDGPLGVRQGPATELPAPIALAAAFDERLARRYGAVVGAEARGMGNDVVHGPTINLMRTPRAGRTFEAYGEDPYLTARTGVAWIRGLQARGVIASVKHFAANSQEVDRYSVEARVDERTLREIYLPHFEAAVREAKAGAVMCAYNRVNGPYACASRRLLEHVLRRDWRFRGFVLSDYGASVAPGTPAVARGGLDLELPLPVAYEPAALRDALASGAISQPLVDRHLRRVFATLFRFRFFDRRAYANDRSRIDFAAHARLARRVAEEGTVLLRNEGGVLPLDASRLRSLAVIGDAAEHVSGGGSSDVEPRHVVTPLDGIRRRAGPGVAVRHDTGADHAAAAALAGDADAAIVFVSDRQTEGWDSPCLALACSHPAGGDQDGLVEAVARANPRTIVVVRSGGPALMPWANRVAAIVEAWYPGLEGGAALARVLFGDVDPGGRLPATFPRAEGDLPTAGSREQFPGVGNVARYSEGVFVGYRHYDERRVRPLFPFGHGLSYTRFAYRRLRADGGRVSVEVRNAGPRPGVEVVQLYLGLPDRPVPQPPLRLAGFRRVALDPGERVRVTFRADARERSYWDVGRRRWRAVPGCWSANVGSSSRDIRARRRVCPG